MEWSQGVDVQRLQTRLRWYASTHGATPCTISALEDIINSETGTALLKLPREAWFSQLVNDVYKPSMHRMYARFLTGVVADFALNVRKTPVPLGRLHTHHPDLFSQLQQHTTALQHIEPYNAQVASALVTHCGAGFKVTHTMAARSHRHRVAPITWTTTTVTTTNNSNSNNDNSSSTHGTIGLGDGDRGPHGGGQGGGGGGGEERWVCIGSGAIEAASHCETSVMQLVQAATIAAQVHDINARIAASSGARHQPGNAQPQTETAAASSAEAEPPPAASPAPEADPGAHPSRQPHHHQLDRTELLANSLARLALVIDALNSSSAGSEGGATDGASGGDDGEGRGGGGGEGGSGGEGGDRDDGCVRVALFAGRRASDRLYLVLQNLAFARLVRGYVGTSSVYVVTVLGQVWDQLGVGPEQRLEMVGPLVGTHAHEQSSVMQQLMAAVDKRAGACRRGEGGREGAGGESEPPPLCVTSLLAHLLFVVASGDLRRATALADTFGSPAFIAVAAAADVPPGFVWAMEAEHGLIVAPGTKCFDLFSTWRLDSGVWEEQAELVMGAWEGRCGERQTRGLPPLPKPRLMHSNLSTVEEVVQVRQLPARIRPHTVAFGTLADGFLPFRMPATAAGDAADAAPSMPTVSSSSSSGGGGGGGGGDNIGAASTAAAPATTPAGGGGAGEGGGRGGAGGQFRRGVGGGGRDGCVEVKLASLVMKAVQARVEGWPVEQVSALKMGDDGGKLEVDPRLPAHQRDAMAELGRALRRVGEVDPTCVSRHLSDAFDLVAGGVFNEQA